MVRNYMEKSCQGTGSKLVRLEQSGWKGYDLERFLGVWQK